MSKKNSARSDRARARILDAAVLGAAVVGAGAAMAACTSAAQLQIGSAARERIHALPACAAPYPPDDIVCMKTSVTNLCEAAARATGDEFPECARRDAIKFDDNGLWAPAPYRSVLLLPAQIKSGEGAVLEAELSLYVFNTACGPEAAVAFAGMHKSGRPIIETERGRIEIESPSLRIGIPDARILINGATGAVISAFRAPNDNQSLYGFRFVSESEVYFAAGGACLRASGADTGLIRQAPGKCGRLLEKDAQGRPGYFYGDEGVAAATAADIVTANKAVPSAMGAWTAAQVKRLAGRDVIVLDTVFACT